MRILLQILTAISGVVMIIGGLKLNHIMIVSGACGILVNVVLYNIMLTAENKP